MRARSLRRSWRLSTGQSTISAALESDSALTIAREDSAMRCSPAVGREIEKHISNISECSSNAPATKTRPKMSTRRAGMPVLLADSPTDIDLSALC